MFGEIIKEIQNITTAIKTDRIVVSSIAFIQRAGLISVCLGAVALTIGAVINEYLKPGRYVLSADSALYQHGGWYMTVGGVPYVDMWDVKPPLAFEVPAVLSLLTGGNPTAQLWLSILTMLIGVVAIIWFTATVITDLTGDQVASVLAATVIVAYPFFFYYAAKGFRPKIFVLAIGLGAIYAAMRGHGFGAGVASGSAAGMWQMGIFFIPMIFLILAQGEVNTHSWRSKKQIRNAIVALTTTTVVVVAPIILQGGLVPMLVETIVIPLGEGENQTIAFAIVKGIFLLGFGSISVVVGLVGPAGIIFSSIRNRLRQELSNAWIFIPAGIIFYSIQVYIDLDYYPDLFPLVVFAALGFGIIVSALNRSQQLGVAAILLIIVAINAGLALGIGPLTGYSPLSATDQAATQLSIDTPPKMNVSAERGPYYNESASEFMNDLYWNRQIPEYCHYRFAGGELRWLEQTNQTYDDDCGVPPPNSPLNLLY